MLDAALTELEEVGFDALSFEVIAARARLRQSAVEQRWPDRIALVADAMRRYRTGRFTGFVDTGSLRGDLIAQCSIAADLLVRLGPPLLVSLSEAWRGHRGLCDALENAIDPSGIRLPREVQVHAVARGELPRGELPSVFEEVAVPVLITRVVTGASVEQAFVEHLTEDIIVPALFAASAGPRP